MCTFRADYESFQNEEQYISNEQTNICERNENANCTSSSCQNYLQPTNYRTSDLSSCRDYLQLIDHLGSTGINEQEFNNAGDYLQPIERNCDNITQNLEENRTFCESINFNHNTNLSLFCVNHQQIKISPAYESNEELENYCYDFSPAGTFYDDIQKHVETKYNEINQNNGTYRDDISSTRTEAHSNSKLSTFLPFQYVQTFTRKIIHSQPSQHK